MINILKIWFFTIIFLLRNKKQVREINKENNDQKSFELIQEFSVYILKKIDIKTSIIGEENLNENDNVLYISNHPSMIDAFILLTFIKTPNSFFIADSSKIILKLPIIKHIFKRMNNVFINRQDMRSGIKSLKEGTKNLNDGFNLVIFPEGQISQVISNDVVGNFKGGAFKTALDAKKDIILISIIPDINIQKKPSIFGGIRSTNVKVIINKRIPYLEFKDYKTSEIAKYTQSIIKKNIEENKNV